MFSVLFCFNLFQVVLTTEPHRPSNLGIWTASIMLLMNKEAITQTVRRLHTEDFWSPNLAHQIATISLILWIYLMHPSGKEFEESVWKKEAILEGDWMSILFFSFFFNTVFIEIFPQIHHQYNSAPFHKYRNITAVQKFSSALRHWPENSLVDV